MLERLRPLFLALVVLSPGCRPKTLRGSVDNQGKPVSGARVRLFAEEQLQSYFRGRGAEAHDRFLDLMAGLFLEENAPAAALLFPGGPAAPTVLLTKDDIKIYQAPAGNRVGVQKYSYDPALHSPADAQKRAQEALDAALASGQLPAWRKKPLVPMGPITDQRSLVAAARARVVGEEGALFDELDAEPLAETITDQEGRFQLPLKFKEERAALVVQATLTLGDGERRCSWGLWVERGLNHPLDLDQGSLLSLRPPNSVLSP